MFALVATPLLYGLSVAILQAINFSGGYGEGRILLALSLFLAVAIGRFIFKSNGPKQAKESNGPGSN
jgi:hypothetical protein